MSNLIKQYTDVYISEALVPKDFKMYEEVIGESSDGPIKKYMMKGLFQEANKVNKNNRKYLVPQLSRETARLLELITEQVGLPSELDHPLPGKEERDIILAQRCTLKNACALIQHLEMNNTQVFGKAELLYDDNSHGTKLFSMVKRGFKPGISSRAIGGKPMMEGGVLIVPENIKFTTYDFVSSPSTHNALLESIVEEQMYYLKESQRPGNVRSVWNVLIDFEKEEL